MKPFGWVLIFLALAGALHGCASPEPSRPSVNDPGEAMERAVALLSDKKYEDARQLLNEIKSVDTTKTYAPLAQLKLAESYAQEGDDAIAITEYRRFLDSYPDNQYAPYAQLQIASIYFSQIKGPDRGAQAAKQALQEYLWLKQRFPRNPYKEAVEANIAKCRDVIAEYEFLVGKFYFKKDSLKAALNRFQGVVADYPEFKDLDQVFYYIVLSHKGLSEMASAASYAEKLKELYPGSPFTRKAAEALAPD